MRKTEYCISCPADIQCTIGLVTDLHEHDPSEVLAILREAKPDMICVAGDTLERRNQGGTLESGKHSLGFRLFWLAADTAELLADRFRMTVRDARTEYAYDFFREAGKIAPVFLSPGNHELYFTDMDRIVMAQYGVTLLENQCVEVDGILFGGLTSKFATGTLDEDFLKQFSSANAYKVLLCHHPEYYKQLSSYSIDLILSGHCHGGQIRMFGRGLFAPGQGLFPKYHHGVYDDKLVVSAGCANTTSVPRWGNETEVVILRLSGKEKK